MTIARPLGKWPAAMMAAAALISRMHAEPVTARARIADRLPRMVDHGGPFLRAPALMTVTFAGDDPARVARLEAFSTFVPGSRWWREVASGYCARDGSCVGASHAGRSLRLPRRLPATVRDVDLEQLLIAELRGTALGQLAADSLLIVYLPPGVLLTDAFTPTYCGDGPRAFHRLLRAGSIAVPFAVIPDCGDESRLTATASHEILEMATNPDPNHPAFRLPPNANVAPFRAFGGEPVDPCGLLNRGQHLIREGPFTLQRAWSNAAAASDADPCVPWVPGRPYAALIPRTPVVRIAPDATVTIHLDAVSSGAIGKWHVTAVDLAERDGAGAHVTTRLNVTVVSNGDTPSLRLSAVGVPAGGVSVVGLISQVGAHEHLWPLAVSVR